MNGHGLDQIARVLGHALRGLCTKADLVAMGGRIMSAISDFAAQVKTYNDRTDAALAAITTDIQALNDKIAELQNTPGAITPEDQALLDGISAHGKAVAEQLEVLDGLTPPAAPKP